MSESKDQVRAVLETLARHAELVAEALSGSVEGGDRTRAKPVDALAGVHALLPYEEGVYHLNPRLRAYLSDHLAFFGAFQTVTRLSEHILRARTQWRELRELKASGSLKDVDKLEWALDDTVSDIVYFTEQNLVLLNSLIFTRYGNVETLKAKLAQNRFYAAEVKVCLRELQQVDQLADEISSESVAAGLPRTRQLVNARLRSRLSHWVTRLNDIQSVITKRLFLARKLEQRLMNLSNVALWLIRNPTRAGSEVSVDTKTPIELVRPEHFKVSPQVDVSEIAPSIREILAAAVRRLPKRKDPFQPEPAPEAQVVVEASMQTIEDPMTDEDRVISDLLRELRSPAASNVSLSRWRRGRTDLQSVTEEEWLLYAATQLVAAGLSVDFVKTERLPSMLNDGFHDVVAYRAG